MFFGTRCSASDISCFVSNPIYFPLFTRDQALAQPSLYNATTNDGMWASAKVLRTRAEIRPKCFVLS